MNRPDTNKHSLDSGKLDPNAIAAQAAALARHLQASGVAFLPKANQEAAKDWESHFAAAATEPAGQAGGQTTAESPARAQPGATEPRSRPAATPRVQSPIVADEVSVSYEGPALAEADRVTQLNVLSTNVDQCTRCEQLATCRTKTVFGEGSVMPRVAFFGEGPGADEDRTGRPFVGKAGQLLTKMIEACSFRREDVYIFNTVKCRPPGNRNPDPSELANCREYFEQQLAILRPEYIVCLGAISTQTLLNSKLSVGRLRGKFHRYYDSKVLVTYHPAYLLRNPDAKKAAWQDLQLMLRDAGIQPK